MKATYFVESNVAYPYPYFIAEDDQEAMRTARRKFKRRSILGNPGRIDVYRLPVAWVDDPAIEGQNPDGSFWVQRARRVHNEAFDFCPPIQIGMILP